jgi:hypothetical protein
MWSCADNQALNEDDDLKLNPFIAHERMLNKYAIMLYTSDDNAGSFTELTETSYCASCGEKV